MAKQSPDEDFKSAISRIEARLREGKQAEIASFYLMLAEDMIRDEVAGRLAELRAKFVRFNQEDSLSFELSRLNAPSASGWHVRVKCFDVEASWHFLLHLTGGKQRVYLMVKAGEEPFAIPRREGLMTAWDLAKTPEVEGRLRVATGRCFELLVARTLRV